MPCNPVWGCFLLGDFPWNRDGNADCVTWNHNGGGGGHSGAIENQVSQYELPLLGTAGNKVRCCLINVDADLAIWITVT